MWAIGASPVTSGGTVVVRPPTDVFASRPRVVPRIRHAFNGVPSHGRTLVGVTIADVGLSSVVVHRLEEAGRSKDRLVASISHGCERR